MQEKTPKYPGLFGRLRLYAVGLSIGIVMMTLFTMAKHREADQKQADAERARQERLAKPDTLFPPIPPATPSTTK